MQQPRLTTGVARWTRGGVVGLLTVLLGSAAHAAAGGQLPSAPVAAGLSLGVSLLAVALSGQRWTASPLLGLFLLAQTGVHLAAMSGGAHHGPMLDPLMIGTHALAAVVLVLVVLHGERALAATLERLVPCAPRAVAPPAATHRGFAVVLAAASSRLVPADLRGRAPPLVS